MSSFGKIILISLCFTIGLTIGCGSDGNKMKISGTVTFSDDGSPLTTGTVMMTSSTKYVRGDLNDKGEYSLGELKDGDGVPLGEYRVSICGAYEATLPDPPYSTPSYIHAKYESPDRSGLKFEVKKDGPKTFDIKVDRPGK